MRHLRKYHPELWQKLIDLEKEPGTVGNKWNMVRGSGITEKEELFYWEDAQMTIFDYLEQKGT